MRFKKYATLLYFYLIKILHNTLKYVGTIYPKISVKRSRGLKNDPVKF